MAEGNHKNHGIRPYVVVALILGVITYIEFAIIEWEIPFLNQTATMWWLIILSIAKFLFVIYYFMHLKDDDAAYSGFFWSGLVIGFGTFVAFSFLMTAPASLSFVRTQLAPDGEFVHGQKKDSYGHSGIDEATLASVESDGYSRNLPSVFDHTRPKDQRVLFTPPAAATGGWTLSEPQTLAADAPTATPNEAPAEASGDDVSAQAPAAEWDRELGVTTYNQVCSACHQATGAGVPGAFPPLAGHAPTLVQVEGGRTHLIHTVLYGLQGPIVAGGMTYNSVMTAQAVDDAQTAAVLNHILNEWGNDAELPEGFTPFTEDEVAAERGLGLTGTDVHEARQALGLE